MIAGVLLVGMVGLATAQPSADGATLTRAAIERRVASLDSAAAVEQDAAARLRLAEEARQLRERLRAGDFLPGDRLLVSTTRGTPPHDTVIVRSDTTISITGLPAVSLKGVLRSELDARMEEHLAAYVREPAFAAVALLRIGVFGGVRAPGYYEVPAESRLSDVVMRAGGPTDAADPKKVVVRRRARELFDQGVGAHALRAGSSLDQLGIQSGDEITVGARRQTPWGQLLQWTTAIAGLVTVIGISR